MHNLQNKHTEKINKKETEGQMPMINQQINQLVSELSDIPTLNTCDCPPRGAPVVYGKHRRIGTAGGGDDLRAVIERE